MLRLWKTLNQTKSSFKSKAYHSSFQNTVSKRHYSQKVLLHVCWTLSFSFQHSQISLLFFCEDKGLKVYLVVCLDYSLLHNFWGLHKGQRAKRPGKPLRIIKMYETGFRQDSEMQRFAKEINAQVASSRVARLTVFLCSFLVSQFLSLNAWFIGIILCANPFTMQSRNKRDFVGRMWSYITLWLARCAKWLVFTDFSLQRRWKVFRPSLRTILVDWTVGRTYLLQFISDLCECQT